MPSWLTPEIRQQLVDGIVVTIALTVITSVAAFALGVIVGVGRLSERRRFRWSATSFVEVFRNVPALILIIFFAFAVPNIFAADLRRTLLFDNEVVDWAKAATGLPVPYYAAAAGLALTLNAAAHIAELFRSGVATLPPARMEGALTLGASPTTVLRTVVIPDAVRAAFPAIATRLVHNMKNTSLVSFVAVPDLYLAIQGAISETFQASSLILMAALLYLALSTVLTLILDLIDLRLRRGRPARRELGV